MLAIRMTYIVFFGSVSITTNFEIGCWCCFSLLSLINKA